MCIHNTTFTHCWKLAVWSLSEEFNSLVEPWFAEEFEERDGDTYIQENSWNSVDKTVPIVQRVFKL